MTQARADDKIIPGVLFLMEEVTMKRLLLLVFVLVFCTAASCEVKPSGVKVKPKPIKFK